MRTQRRSPGLTQERREQGEARNAKWAALSPAEKLAVINHRLGVGIGATRQRRILASLLQDPTETAQKAHNKGGKARRGEKQNG